MNRAEVPAGPFQSILCPVDFSAESRVALQHGVAIARRTGGRLTAMYADDPMLAAAAAIDNEPRLTAQTETELRRFLIRAGIPLARDPRAADVVGVIGRPAPEILKLARRLKSDLIVMGTQGRSGAGRMFFGSVTEQVLRQTPAPVLAVPSTAGGRIANGWPEGRLLCAVEFGPRARADVAAAASVAVAFKAGLTLLHVITPSFGVPWLAAKLRDRDREDLQGARTRLAALARRAQDALGAPIESRVLLGHPGETIAAAAADLDAGLIVLTLRPGHGLFGPRQGSITYRVLSGTAVPVLALRQAAAAARR